MLDAVPTHIKFIEGNNIFRKVVANAVIRTELTADCVFRCQQIGDLNIQLFAALVTYKINCLFCRRLPHSRGAAIPDTLYSPK